MSTEQSQQAGANADELRRLLAYLERELDEGRLVGLAIGAVLTNMPVGVENTRSFIVGFQACGAAPLAGAVKLLDATIVRHLLTRVREGAP